MGAAQWWEGPACAASEWSESDGEFEVAMRDLSPGRNTLDGRRRALFDGEGPAIRLEARESGWGIALNAGVEDWLLESNRREAHNALDGLRSYATLDLAHATGHLWGGDLTTGVRLAGSRLDTSGVLERVARGIPGFEQGDASLLWTEQSVIAEVALIHDQSRLAIAAGHGVSHQKLELAGEGSDALTLNVKPDGPFLALSAEHSLGDLRIEGLYRYSQLKDSGTVARSGRGRLGPATARQRSSLAGLAIGTPGDQGGWRISLLHGSDHSSLVGSASLNGFTGPLFGLTTPRGHLDASLATVRSTALLSLPDRGWGPWECDWTVGATRWTTDGEAVTYGSVLFGGLRTDEQRTTLELESGWLVHLGVAARYPLREGVRLNVELSQSVPLAVERSDDGAILPPGPPRDRHTDGGRLIQLGLIFDL